MAIPTGDVVNGLEEPSTASFDSLSVHSVEECPTDRPFAGWAGLECSLVTKCSRADARIYRSGKWWWYLGGGRSTHEVSVDGQ